MLVCQSGRQARMNEVLEMERGARDAFWRLCIHTWAIAAIHCNDTDHDLPWFRKQQVVSQKTITGLRNGVYVIGLCFKSCGAAYFCAWEASATNTVDVALYLKKSWCELVDWEISSQYHPWWVHLRKIWFALLFQGRVYNDITWECTKFQGENQFPCPRDKIFTKPFSHAHTTTHCTLLARGVHVFSKFSSSPNIHVNPASIMRDF